MKNKILKYILIFWIVIVAVAYYIMLPPINPTSIEFWVFFIPAVFAPLFIYVQLKSFKGGLKHGKAFYPTVILIGMVAIYLIGCMIFSPVFNADNYNKRIDIISSSFEEDIAEVDFDNLPLLDKASSQKVGDRVVGQIASLVSQFTVSDEYSLINYNNQIVRVTPLEHNGIFKYFANLSGTAGYVIVDCTTGSAKLVETEEGLKYLPSAYFSKDLYRHVRFHYPFEIIGDASFEIDEQGNPYWVIQTLKYTWVNMKTVVSGVITVNAIDGTTQKYSVSEVPSWIDNVYDANLVMNEIDCWGLYRNGFINSKFAQKDVVQTTDGYTYIVKDDDVYMYTGITSIANDESNIGFVLVNMRTHQAKYYGVAGAEEYSAMNSAVGKVQEKNYVSTFPLLINLNGRPTYLLSLKDDAGLVKMYAFVDVADYQKVSVSDASLGVKEAANTYIKMMGMETISSDMLISKDIIIHQVKEAVIDGNTYYFIITLENEKYQIKASVNPNITVFMQENEQYTIKYYNDGSYNIIEAIDYPRYIEGDNGV
ncbi:MAG: hypothetical protein ACI4WG_01720 [Erysipelotrichaceae bacterium]